MVAAKDGYDPRFVWALLRTPETRADLILLSTGIGRSRVAWDDLRQVQLPVLDGVSIESIVAELNAAEEAEAEADRCREAARQVLHVDFQMDNQVAQDILAAFKPPR